MVSAITKKYLIFSVLMFVAVPTFAETNVPGLCPQIWGAPIREGNSLSKLGQYSDKPLDVEARAEVFELLRDVLPKYLVHYKTEQRRANTPWAVGPFMMYFSSAEGIGFSYNPYATEPKVITFNSKNLSEVNVYGGSLSNETFIRVYFRLTTPAGPVLAMMTFAEFDRNSKPTALDFSYFSEDGGFTAFGVAR